LPLSPLLLPTRALRYSSRFETGRKQGARFGQNTEGVTETCKQGHELSSANLYISPKGRHFCRKCKAEALDFVAQGKVKTIIETYPLAEAAKAYDRVAEGKARFRTVLTM
jgi:threonine dehydrogenase-like Zn-dependent dehydrogenase